MTDQPKKRVFLSFDHDDAAQVNGLRGVIQNPNHELEAYDESVRAPIESEDAGYIKSVIGEKIKRSSVTVCLVGKTTHQSKWVHWELVKSVRAKNAIIAMALNGVTNPPLPNYLKQIKIPCLPWNLDLLQDLIAQAR